jgi:hypothetical protein
MYGGCDTLVDHTSLHRVYFRCLRASSLLFSGWTMARLFAITHKYYRVYQKQRHLQLYNDQLLNIKKGWTNLISRESSLWHYWQILFGMEWIGPGFQVSGLIISRQLPQWSENIQDPRSKVLTFPPWLWFSVGDRSGLFAGHVPLIQN